MDPRDFISVAIRLSNSQREADLRSAVSRAYYGAFHLACELVEDCHVRLSSKAFYAAEIHKKVRYCLRESGNFEAGKASEKLASLRGQRNEADYNLSSTKFTPETTALQIRAAHEILDALDRCRVEPAFSQFREKLMIYARDVLKMPVDDA